MDLEGIGREGMRRDYMKWEGMGRDRKGQDGKVR